MIRYTHPNLLFISWKHWVPSYVRNEIKKKTGVAIDGYGNKVEEKEEEGKEPTNPDELLMQNMKNPTTMNNTSKSKNSYKPTGNLIYNTALFKNIGRDLRNNSFH